MNRIEKLVHDKFPESGKEMMRVIEEMKKDYDSDQFLEEDIIEAILIRLNII